jgi:hypothetical protein
MTEEIHPFVRKTGYSNQWNAETNDLINRHPYSNRILLLANNPKLSKRCVGNLSEPNCFGTGFWVLGVVHSEFPHYLSSNQAGILLERRFTQINEKDILDVPGEGILRVNKMGRIPAHVAIYLGRSCNKPVLFDQEGLGMDFRLLIPHPDTGKVDYYRLNPNRGLFYDLFGI